MSTPGHRDRPRTAKTLLHRALDLPPDERRAFLEARLEPGATLDDALELLEGAAELDGFLDQPFALGREGFDPAVPEHIGEFRVERVLGWGSMGVVYLARQERPARPVALKLLRIDTTGPGGAERFRREADVLARLAHPGIASVHATGVVDLGAGRQPWIAMEFIEGAPLTTHAERECLDRGARVRLVLETARAVQHAHERGVVHRDLKPENVLVRPDGRVCVLDFGVAHVAADEASALALTATGQIIGTLTYMAPEQARGGTVGPAADQFALGALLYELLTGELPLPVRGRLPHEALRVVADGEWRPPTRHDPTLAGDLEAILATALAPEPSRRYATVEALAKDLERWLEGRPVHARPPSPLEGIGRQLRRHPVLAGVSALAFVVLGALLAVLLQANLERDREREVALLFSDRALHDSLHSALDSLQPYGGTPLAEFDAWLARAEELLSRAAGHRAAVARMLGDTQSRSATIGTEVGEDWFVQQIEALVADLEVFEPLLEEVRRSREERATLYERSIGSRTETWAGAAGRVAADPRFDGLVLEPQLGLVPLGPDPESGLEEFAVLGTGEVPERAPGGRIVPALGEAVVLVLVPGGARWMGCQRDDPEGINYSDLWYHMEYHEGPPVLLTLDAFLIGKFELTQDQWIRFTGVNPSDWEIGSEITGHVIGPLHPVESLSWQQAREVLPRYGMDLPTEAQWEVAARGGSPWARVQGRSTTDLVGYVNWGTYTDGRSEEVPDDGWMSHMPVGSLLPNPYGLHDTLGNVWELCRDVYKVDYYEREHRAGDGLVLAEPDGDVTRRGLSADSLPQLCSPYKRQVKRFDGRDSLTGVRPVRALEGESQESWRSPPGSAD